MSDPSKLLNWFSRSKSACRSARRWTSARSREDAAALSRSSAGTFEGPGIQGRVLPGGADWQIVRADGVADLDTRYTLETDDGKLIYVQNPGIRHAPPEVTARLMKGEPVDPSLVYFRSAPKFETSAPELAWLTRSIFVGTGERYPADVVIRFWKLAYKSQPSISTIFWRTAAVSSAR